MTYCSQGWPTIHTFPSVIHFPPPHTHTHTHTHTRTCTHSHTHTHTYTIYTLSYTHTHTHTHTSLCNTHMRAHKCRASQKNLVYSLRWGPHWGGDGARHPGSRVCRRLDGGPTNQWKTYHPRSEFQLEALGDPSHFHLSSSFVISCSVEGIFLVDIYLQCTKPQLHG